MIIIIHSICINCVDVCMSLYSGIKLILYQHINKVRQRKYWYVFIKNIGIRIWVKCLMRFLLRTYPRLGLCVMKFSCKSTPTPNNIQFTIIIKFWLKPNTRQKRHVTNYNNITTTTMHNSYLLLNCTLFFIFLFL